MADHQPQEVEVDFNDTTGGRRLLAPPRSLFPGEQAIWRDSLNLVPRNGLLQRRHGLTPIIGSFNKSLLPATYDLAAGTNTERPVWIYSSLSPQPLTYSSLTGGLNGLIPYRFYTVDSASVTVVVTNRQAFVYNDAAGTFVNVTPTYGAGTIAVTNGSPNVTGTGTAWATRSISPFQQMKISGTWYQIYQVVDDTHIVLATNFSGTTAPGLAYTIQRTWGMGNSCGTDRSSLIFCVAYNQSVYLASTFLGRADGIPTPTVVKVANILSATPTTSYITSSAALVSGLDTFAATSISGLAVLQDSRLIVSGDQSTIYYSSNLTDVVWTSTPAGFSVVEHKSGAIHAMEWLGSNLTLHFDSGIVNAAPSGQSDPPLNFTDTHATVGCVYPKTLKEWNRRLYFMAFDNNTYFFDGYQTISIGNDIMNDSNFSGTSTEELKNCLFAGVNNKFGEYTIYRYGTGATSAWTLTLDGSWWPLQFPVPIGAVSDLDCISPNRGYGLAGVLSTDSLLGEGNMLWQMVSGAAGPDSVVYTGMLTGGFYADTDDLDLRQIIDKAALTYKNVLSVVIWMRGLSADSGTYYVRASRDGGLTWTDSSHKAISVPVTGETALQFSLLDLSSTETFFRFRITGESTTVWQIQITRIVITALPMGDKGLVGL